MTVKTTQRLCLAVFLFAIGSAGCGTGSSGRIREYSPLMRRYQATRQACDPDGADSTVTKTGCPVCVY